MANRRIEFANLVVRTESKTLLDLFDDLMFPLFFNGDLKRSYGGTSYIFLNVKMVRVGGRGGEGIAIVGRLVKDEFIEIKQKLTNGKLQDADEMHQRSPSSIFVLFLKDHRLAFVREHAGSPTLKAFKSTIQSLLRKVHKEFIKELLAKKLVDVARGETQEVRTEVKRLNPVPTVNLVPLEDARDILRAIRAMDSVYSLRFEVVRTNDEFNPNEVFEDVREVKVGLGDPDKALITFSDSSQRINLSSAASLVGKAVDDQNVIYHVDGAGAGQKIKYTNSIDGGDGADGSMSVTAPLPNDEASPVQVARYAFSEYERMIDAGVIRQPNMLDDNEINRRIIELYDRYGGDDRVA